MPLSAKIAIFALKLETLCRWILILSLQKNIRRQTDYLHIWFEFIVPKGKYRVYGLRGKTWNVTKYAPLPQRKNTCNKIMSLLKALPQ